MQPGCARPKHKYLADGDTKLIGKDNYMGRRFSLSLGSSRPYTGRFWWQTRMHHYVPCMAGSAAVLHNRNAFWLSIGGAANAKAFSPGRAAVWSRS